MAGFAERLRNLREQKNLSQIELGQQAGLHHTHIGRFEHSLSRPGGDILKRLADALGVTGQYLLEGVEDDCGFQRMPAEDTDLMSGIERVFGLSGVSQSSLRGTTGYHPSPAARSQAGSRRRP